MKHLRAGLALPLLIAVACGAGATRSPGPTAETPRLPAYQADSDWFTDGAGRVDRGRSQPIINTPGAAKNLILFVGDGMGMTTVTAARILAGQQLGLHGEEHELSFETMPFAGLVKTYNTNQQTSDSAGTMTAMVTGVKTRAGVLSVAEDVELGDCDAGLERQLVTSLELAALAGKSTGVVSTARITHATPAATFAKVSSRSWEGRAPEPCVDIASQMVTFPAGDGVDLVLGGGRAVFLPTDVTDIEGEQGWREDGRNLVDEWLGRYDDGSTHAVYVEDQNGFDAVDVARTDKLLGLFQPSHMRYEADRGNDKAGEPSLSEMTAKAIEFLERDDDGFYLVVESGRIDHGHHAGSAFNALTDAVEFSEAIRVAMEATSADDTLIIVTADHSHVMTMSGYPTRGNPILGKVVSNDSSGNPLAEPSTAGDDMPYTTLGYYNGLGFADLGDTTDADIRYEHSNAVGRVDLTEVNTENPGFHQEALVPTRSETHGGEDVGVWARGPGAHLISGTIEQSVIFHVMVHAGGLLP